MTTKINQSTPLKNLSRLGTILATVFLLSLASCSKDDITEYVPTPPDCEIGEQRTALLRIVEQQSSGGTRSVGRPICDNEPVRFNRGDVYLINYATGAIFKHIRVLDGAASGQLFTEGAINTIGRDVLLGTGIAIEGVSPQINHVVVIGNPQVDLPTSGNINAVLSLLITDGTRANIASQHDVITPGVNMFGRSPLQPEFDNGAPVLSSDGYHIHSGTVMLAPTVARFELHSIVGMGDIAGFRVSGIFMDNYYIAARRDGTRPAANNLRNHGTVHTNFAAGMHEFIQMSSGTGFVAGTLFTQYTTPLAAAIVNNLLTARPAGMTNEGCHSATPPACPYELLHGNLPNVWGYQVFARHPSHYGLTPPAVSSTQPPRMIVRLSDVYVYNAANVAVPHVSPTGAWYLTVSDFIVTGTGVRLSAIGIRASNVYRITRLAFDELDLTIQPNLDAISAEVDITLAHWNVEDVNQGGLRQPNPRGGTIALNETHSFPLGAAINGYSNAAVSYQWQRSVNGTDWTDILGATNATFTAQNLTVTTYFRRVAYVPSTTIREVTNPARVEVVQGISTGMRGTEGFAIWAFHNLYQPGVFAPSHAVTYHRLFQWGTHPADVVNVWTLLPETYTTAAGVPNWNNSIDRVAWTDATDPCPAGWRVPTIAQLTTLATGQTNADRITFDGILGRIFPAGGTSAGIGTTHIFVPFTGARLGNAGGFGFVNTGNIWSSDGVAAWAGGRYVLYVGNFSSERMDDLISSGYNIRCVADI